MADEDPKSASMPTGKGAREDAAVYREDDTTFKNRLKENLVNHWLLNTLATLVIFVVVFYLLTGQFLTGLLAGLLVLMASNLGNVLWRIKDFERWEIFSNGVKLGYDLGIQKGIRGEVLILEVKGRKLKYPYKYNKDIFDLLRRKYDAFQEIQRSPKDGPL